MRKLATAAAFFLTLAASASAQQREAIAGSDWYIFTSSTGTRYLSSTDSGYKGSSLFIGCEDSQYSVTVSANSADYPVLDKSKVSALITADPSLKDYKTIFGTVATTSYSSLFLADAAGSREIIKMALINPDFYFYTNDTGAFYAHVDTSQFIKVLPELRC